MSFILLMIIGAAAGFFASRFMKVDSDLPTTVAIGVVGALVGGYLVRFLIALMGAAAGFVGAFFGALLLIWLWQKYKR